MSGKTARRVLFVVALVTVPVPFYLGDTEAAPVVRLTLFTSLFFAVFAVEGGTTTGLLAGLGALQTLFWCGVLWLLAAITARTLERLSAARARSAVVAAIAVALVSLSFFDVYETPLSSTRLRSNLMHVFE